MYNMYVLCTAQVSYTVPLVRSGSTAMDVIHTVTPGRPVTACG
jgi:hypothetical protein